MPMAPITDTQRATSLQKLLSLEKEAQDFTHQVKNAALILGFDLDSDITRDQIAALQKRQHHGRAEWVLKWLLEKLRSPQGQDARLTVEPWRLLFQLLLLVPTSNAALILSKASFLSTLERTFDDIVNRSNVKSEIEVTQEQQEPSTTTESGRSSKKRKRAATVKEDNVDRLVSLPPSSVDKLFSVITTVISSILEKTGIEGSFEENLVGEHMKSVLRVESSEGARILHVWLQAIYHHLLNSPLISSDIITRHLEVICYIWGSKIVDTTQASDPLALFAKECLPYTTLVLGAVVGSEEYRLHPERWRESVRLLEELIGRHFWVPLRVGHRAQQEAKIKPNVQPQSPTRLLNTCLDFLRTIIEPVSNSNVYESVDALRAAEAMPLLYRIAIRSSPRHTPKGRMNESPWLQDVFVSLAACLGCNVAQDDGTTSSEKSVQILTRLIGIAREYGVTMEAALLRSLTLRFTGLALPKSPESMNWNLVGELVALDPDIFLIDEYEGGNAEATHVSITTALFLSCSGDDVSANPELLQQVQNDVIVPLIRAAAKARQLMWFIAKWDDRLIATYQNSLKGPKSVWKSSGTTSVLSEILESALTTTQIHNLLKHHMERVDIDPLQDEMALANGRASITLISVLLDALHSIPVVESTLPQIQAMQHKCIKFVAGQGAIPQHFLPDTWKILSRVHTLLWPFNKVMLQENPDFHAAELGVLSQAVSYCCSSINNDDSYVQAAGIEAFAYVINIGSHLMEVLTDSASIRKAVVQISALVSEPFSPELPRPDESRSSRKNKGKITEDSGLSSILHMSAIIVRFPYALELVPSREVFFLRLLWYSFLEYDNLNKEKRDSALNWSMILEAISEHVLSSPSIAVKNDLLSIYYRALVGNIAEDTMDQHQVQLLEFSESLYLKTPHGTLPRKLREPVIDRTVDNLRQASRFTTPQKLIQRLSLLNHLVESPNFSSLLYTDPNALWDIADCLDTEVAGSDETVLLLFEEIVSCTLNQLVSAVDSKRKAFLRAFFERLQTHMRGQTSSSISIPVLRLVRSSMIVLNKAAETLGLNIDEDAQRKYGKKLLKALEKVAGSSLSSTATKIYSILETLSTIVGISNDSDWGDEFAPSLLKLKKSLLERNEVEPAMSTLIHLHSLGASFAYPSLIDIFWNDTEDLLSSVTTSFDRSRVLRSTQTVISKMTLQERVILTHRLLEHQGNISTPRILVIDALLSSLIRDDSTQKDSAHFLAHLCILLPKSRDLAEFHALMDCLDTIVGEKAWLTTQFGVDTLLSSLASTASPTGPLLPTLASYEVYARLCTTARTLLSLHRTKLGGRMHLLLSFLQNLLKCLFIPDSRPTKRNNNIHPPWLDPWKSPLNSTHAALYARLLSSLCDPSVSSVSDHRHGHGTANLTDDRAKARRYAGQYVQIVLMQYMSCVLSGRLFDNAAMTALKPGLWAAFDVLDEDGARALSSGLDARSRAVWKGLWAEWKKVGN